MQNKSDFFKQVYQQNKDKIYRLCLGFVGNTFDADDLLQEILIKVWNNLDTFKGNSKVSTWIYRIATNTAILYANRKKSLVQKNQNLQKDALYPISAKEDNDVKEEQINALYTAISTLKEIDRIIISLVFDDCSYQEIAQITGLNTSNVGVRINRIKKQLTNKLA